jgi:flagellar basal body L-ring protein FlgH
MTRNASLFAAIPIMLVAGSACGAGPGDSSATSYAAQTQTSPTTTPTIPASEAVAGTAMLDGNDDVYPDAKSEQRTDQLAVNVLRANVALNDLRFTWVDGAVGTLPAPEPKERLFG